MSLVYFILFSTVEIPFFLPPFPCLILEIRDDDIYTHHLHEFIRRLCRCRCRGGVCFTFWIPGSEDIN